MNPIQMLLQLLNLNKRAVNLLLIAAGIVLTGTSPLWAAYRVYQLKVIHYDERNRPSPKGLVITNLDPYQYQNYQGEYGRIRVEMVDTWYCPGDTSRQGYCKKPKNKELQRGPAGLLAPKRDFLPYQLSPVIP